MGSRPSGEELRTTGDTRQSYRTITVTAADVQRARGQSNFGANGAHFSAMMRAPWRRYQPANNLVSCFWQNENVIQSPQRMLGSQRLQTTAASFKEAYWWVMPTLRRGGRGDLPVEILDGFIQAWVEQGHYGLTRTTRLHDLSRLIRFLNPEP